MIRIFFRKLYGRFWKKFPEVENFLKTLSGTGHFREVAERVPPSAALKAKRCYNSITGTPVRFQNRCRNGVPVRSASTTALEWGGCYRGVGYERERERDIYIYIYIYIYI